MITSDEGLPGRLRECRCDGITAYVAMLVLRDYEAIDERRQTATIKVPSPSSTDSSSLLYLFDLGFRLEIGCFYSRLFVKDDLLLPLSVSSSYLKLEREIGHPTFKINALVTGIDRSKSNIELPTVKAPSSDAIDMHAVLMRDAVRGSDIGTISGEIRSKVKPSELLVLPEANPRPDQFFGLRV